MLFLENTLKIIFQCFVFFAKADPERGWPFFFRGELTFFFFNLRCASSIVSILT